MPIFVEIAAGELIDKITILEIKLDQIEDAAKRANIRREYEQLSAVFHEHISPSDELAQLTAALKGANQELWQIEDDIRERERMKDFDPEFVALARAVYQTNDRRAALKREINALLQSSIFEEKSYAAY
jgi:hypothetical protein